MIVVRDKHGKVACVFRHFSDAVAYVESNKRHFFTQQDEPGLDALLTQLLPEIERIVDERAIRSHR